MTAMRIGFFGLGQMGRLMAGRLVDAGFDITAYDVAAPCRDALAAAGATVHDDPRKVAEGRDVIITMLPDDKVVADALFGAQGIAGSLASGTIVVDMSSASPTGTLETGRRLSEIGVTMVDAPVSGGTPGAAAGTLAIMVGAQEIGTFERLQPVFAVLGRAKYVGRLGAGHAAKSINNVISASIIAATSEGLILAERFGLDPAVMLEIVNMSTARSFPSETLFPTQILPRKFESGFALALMAKDSGIAADLGRQLDIDLPSIALAAERWSAAHKALPGADFSKIFLFVEQQAGSNRIASNE